ncbi:MAG: hypothetical protein ABIF88_00135 [archaeon]
MKTSKILFIISTLGILFLLLVAQTTQKTHTGKITKIQYSTNKITLTLENYNETLILFDNKILDLKEGDKISFKGRPEIYQNQSQIIVNEIIKIS